MLGLAESLLLCKREQIFTEVKDEKTKEYLKNNVRRAKATFDNFHDKTKEFLSKGR